MNPESVLAFLTPRAEAWISRQRKLHRPVSLSLAARDATILAPYFTPTLLERARYCVVEHIDNPDFYPELIQAMPTVQLIDFSAMDGITFDDTICVSRRNAPRDITSLMFHELVHVSQYKQLGVSGFTSRYLRSWVEGGMQYLAIQLEIDAYQLQARFDQGGHAFSVEQAVAQQLSQRLRT